MKKHRMAFVLAFAGLSTGAVAEWTALEKYEDNTEVLVDAATVQRSGDQAQLLHLVRWGEAQVDEGLAPYRSTVVRTAYDCQAKTQKYLGSVSFAGPMGGGEEIVSDDDEAERWITVSDASMEEKLWALACASAGP